MPSGMDSKRYPLRNVSPTVISGEAVTPGMTGVSMDGRAVLKPLPLLPAPAGAADAAAATAPVIAMASAVPATIGCLLMPSPSPGVRGDVRSTASGGPRLGLCAPIRKVPALRRVDQRL